MVYLNNDWDDCLKDEFEKDYYQNLRRFLVDEYNHHTVYPDMYDIFNSLKYTAYKDVKVVILGQDPYHGPGQAHGCCFSVQDGIAQPPSLKNIFKELKDDMGYEPPVSGNLTQWAKQGVLLLNTVLTVRAGQANSHAGKGWEKLTDHIIELLNQRDEPIVFLLWGRNAQSKIPLITNPNHLILKAAHPSPLSAYNGFFGCKHFSKTNSFLLQQGKQPINWQL